MVMHTAFLANAFQLFYSTGVPNTATSGALSISHPVFGLPWTHQVLQKSPMVRFTTFLANVFLSCIQHLGA